MPHSQLSFFSAQSRPALPDDLEGLLCGPGQAVHRGAEARVSVIVDDGWRPAALTLELAGMGLAGDTAPAPGGGVSVRTCFAEALTAVADRWVATGVKRAPAGLALDGPRLRWWALAVGDSSGSGYMLGLGPQDDDVWGPVGAALAAAGLPATFLGPRADGPAYRIIGQRRIARLRELVGDPPDGVPVESWPGRTLA